MKEPSRKSSYVYLNLEGQPRGNYMLDRLVKAGFPPVAVIEESSTLAEKGRLNLLNELRQVESEHPLPPSLKTIVRECDVRHYQVKNHNDEHCEEIITEHRPNLIVLGDTRIIKSNIYSIPALGVVNVHPGYLPDIRGNTTYIWAIVHDLPLGCSVHFIDNDIDTGPLIIREKLKLCRGATYAHLLAAINQLCGKLIVETMILLENGDAPRIPQEQIPREIPEFPTFRYAPHETKANAIEKLRLGTYRFLVD